VKRGLHSRPVCDSTPTCTLSFHPAPSLPESAHPESEQAQSISTTACKTQHLTLLRGPTWLGAPANNTSKEAAVLIASREVSGGTEGTWHELPSRLARSNPVKGDVMGCERGRV
jgi:hypothetical protein